MAHSAALADTEDAATPDLERLRQFASQGSPGAHAYVVLLGMNTFDPREVMRAVNKGLPYRAFDRFCRNSGLSFDAVIALIDIPRRTMTRRKAEGRFLPSESDRLLRVSRLFAQVLDLFEGNRDAATGWLAAAQSALGDAAPLDLARTEVGSREVERLIARLEHGVFSQDASVVITAWRIVKAKHLARAFDGEGARVAGGRWNSPGLPMIYTAQSAALAALEMLVHLNSGALLSSYVLIPCSFTEQVVLRLDRARLPTRWRAHPAVPQLQLLGDAWLKNGLSAVLEVPSVIISSESNYLLNPGHADFASISLGPTQPFDFDARLMKS